MATKATRRAAPAAPAIGRRRLLRVLGTDISCLEAVRRRASADLGFDIAFEVLDFPNCQRKAALSPDTYDVYDQCFHNLPIVWAWGALQPLDTDLLRTWDEVGPLTKLGGVDKYASRGFGDVPMNKMYVQPDQSLGPEPSRYVAMLPTVHNFDSFGYDTTVFNGESRPRESWGMLFDPRAKGRLALVDEPGIGLFDAALAAEALGVLKFENIGNMTPSELAALFRFLRAKHAEGFFLRCWSTGSEAADLFRTGQAAVQSMWSPAYNELGPAASRVRESEPEEGYRAWHGGLSVARHVEGATLRMAYEYMDWWLSGWAGATMARQGYYISAQRSLRAHMNAAEWDYWYGGQPAVEDLPGVDGETIVVRAGARRSGGSYLERARRIAIWNTVMDEHNYASRLWSRFVAEVNGRGR
jgi:putative spermidine/putrescine transport system substrate-binding protein